MIMIGIVTSDDLLRLATRGRIIRISSRLKNIAETGGIFDDPWTNLDMDINNFGMMNRDVRNALVQS